MVHDLVAEPAALAGATRALALTLCGHAPPTLRATKQILLRQRPPVVPANDLLLACYRSRDFREGTTAFGAKRAPRWRGR